MVVQVSLSHGGENDGVTFYDIVVYETRGRTWRTRKRFNDFKEFDKQLKADGSLSVFDLPTTGLLGVRKSLHMAEFMDMRKEGLARYLTHLCVQVEAVGESTLLHSFLERDSYRKEPPATEADLFALLGGLPDAQRADLAAAESRVEPALANGVEPAPAEVESTPIVVGSTPDEAIVGRSVEPAESDDSLKANGEVDAGSAGADTGGGAESMLFEADGTPKDVLLDSRNDALLKAGGVKVSASFPDNEAPAQRWSQYMKDDGRPVNVSEVVEAVAADRKVSFGLAELDDASEATRPSPSLRSTEATRFEDEIILQDVNAGGFSKCFEPEVASHQAAGHNGIEDTKSDKEPVNLICGSPMAGPQSSSGMEEPAPETPPLKSRTIDVDAEDWSAQKIARTESMNEDDPFKRGTSSSLQKQDSEVKQPEPEEGTVHAIGEQVLGVGCQKEEPIEAENHNSHVEPQEALANKTSGCTGEVDVVDAPAKSIPPPPCCPRSEQVVVQSKGMTPRLDSLPSELRRNREAPETVDETPTAAEIQRRPDELNAEAPSIAARRTRGDDLPSTSSLAPSQSDQAPTSIAEAGRPTADVGFGRRPSIHKAGTVPLGKRRAATEAANMRPKMKLANLQEHNVLKAGIQALHEAFVVSRQANVTELPRRPNGTVAVMASSASFLTRLLGNEIQFEACMKTDIAAAQPDLKKLSLEQLLAIRSRTLEFSTESLSHSAHTGFLTMVDKHLFENLVRRLTRAPAADSLPTNNETLTALGVRVVLILGAAKKLADGYEVSTGPGNHLPGRPASGQEARPSDVAAPAAPIIWAIRLQKEEWVGSVPGEDCSVVLFNHVDLWLQVMPGAKPDFGAACSDSLQKVAVIADQTQGKGKARMLHWLITILDTRSDDILVELARAERGSPALQRSLPGDLASVLQKRAAATASRLRLRGESESTVSGATPSNCIEDPASTSNSFCVPVSESGSWFAPPTRTV